MAPVIQIAQEGDWRGLVQGRRFENALVVGPAVLAPLTNVSFTNCVFEADPEALFIEVEEGREMVGVVVLRDVVFENCRFQNIAISGTREAIRPIRQTMHRALQEASPVEGVSPSPEVPLPSAAFSPPSS